MEYLLKDSNSIFIANKTVEGLEILGEYADAADAKDALIALAQSEEQRQQGMIFSYINI